MSKRGKRNRQVNQDYAHMSKDTDNTALITKLQRRIEALESENQQLKRQLEITQRVGTVLQQSGGASGHFWLEQLQQVMNERDTLKNAIATHYQEAVNKTHIEVERTYEQFKEERLKLDIRGGVESGVKRMLLDAANLIMNVAAKDYNEKLEPKVHQLLVSGGGVFDNPVLALTQAGHLLEMKGRMSYASAITTVAIMQQCPPEYICSYVVSRLKHKGEVDEISLEALPPNWIQDNIPEAPAKVSTLKEWLEIAYQFRISGQDQETFARAKHCPTRRLRDYLRCLEAFEYAAMQYENEDRTKNGQK